MTGRRVLLAALAAAAGAGAAGAAEDPLAAYRWRERVLVISAPDADDARLSAQRQALANADPGLRERDLRVIEAVGGDAAAQVMRRRLRLEPGAFTAVLIGKDGETKILAGEPIAPQRLFAVIDAMPMRRDEMRR